MQQALMEAKSVEQPHRLTLDSRSRLSVTGVLEVESFDETEILLTSTRGPLSIRGQGLRLQQLSIDGGQVLVDGSVDAIVIFTTDGKLSTADATVLTDDEGFFPSYQCGNVVRNQLLQQHPELRDVLDKLQGTISDQDMARMNYEVEAEGKDPKTVAEEFLNSKGLI